MHLLERLTEFDYGFIAMVFKFHISTSCSIFMAAEACLVLKSQQAGPMRFWIDAHAPIKVIRAFTVITRIKFHEPFAAAGTVIIGFAELPAFLNQAAIILIVSRQYFADMPEVSAAP